MGDGTYAILNLGALIDTDAITVALFDDTKNRPSLNQKFALVENSETIVISVNHLKSKGSSCGEGEGEGEYDETTGQGSCNLTCSRAAQALTTFIACE